MQTATLPRCVKPPKTKPGDEGTPSQYEVEGYRFGFQIIEDVQFMEAVRQAQNVLRREIGDMVFLYGHFRPKSLGLASDVNTWTYRKTGYMIFVRISPDPLTTENV